jgi:predicted SAM-dependent methyltransferase
MEYLNLGCGSRFHPDWTNIDLVPNDPRIQAHNLRRGIPYPDNTFDAVYHSHLLEHLPRADALKLLQECNRVLTAGGVIRVTVPDLESMVRIYLQALEEAVQGSAHWQANYDWIMLELYDQTVRERSGGEMGAYLARADMPNKEFVLHRVGAEAKSIIDREERQRDKASRKRYQSVLEGMGRFYRIACRWNVFREGWLQLFLGSDYALLKLGRFRRSGELHLWMYDRYSLAQLLRQAGFQNAIQRTAFESAVPNWPDFNLDTDPDGTVYKPDSLYMEAVKPADASPDGSQDRRSCAWTR